MITHLLNWFTKSKKVNVFGWSSVEWVYTATGSSSSGCVRPEYGDDNSTNRSGDKNLISTKNHNKSVAVDGKKYTLYCNKDGSASDYLNAWCCVGFGVDKA